MTFEEAIEIIVEECGVEEGDGFFTNGRDLDTFLALSIIKNLQETYAPKIKMNSKQKDELMQLKIQVEISKAYFKNILKVDPNISIGSPSHLENCVRVMKTSAKNALKHLEKIDEQ